MSGAVLTYDGRGLKRVAKPIDSLAQIDRRALMDVVGATIESQTKRRIEDEKTDPEGTRWQAWSEGYAETRHQGNSLLMGAGDLDDSLTHTVLLGADCVEVGSNLIYAATHQYGDERRNIPARPYLGISSDDEAEIYAVLDDFLERTTA